MDNEQIHVHIHLPKELTSELAAMRAELRKLLALVLVDSTQVAAVEAALTQLKTDSASAFADITAKLQTISGTADPATAAALASVISDLGTLDTSTKAIDPGPIVTTAPTS